MVASFSQEELVPEEIMEWWVVKKGNEAMPQVCVKWAELPKESATWEDW
jgi:hypothetical protein